MKKYIKWGIVIIVGAGLTTLGIHTFTPRENEDLAAVKDVAPTQKNRSLNINAQIIRPHLLTDELFVSGKLMPDEEVDLSFEASGKIVYNPQNEMFRLLGTKRSFSQNETFFFSHPYPPTLPFST